MMHDNAHGTCVSLASGCLSCARVPLNAKAHVNTFVNTNAHVNEAVFDHRNNDGRSRLALDRSGRNLRARGEMESVAKQRAT